MVQQVKVQYVGSLAPGACSLLHYGDEADETAIANSVAAFMDEFSVRLATNVQFVWSGEIRQYDTATGTLTGVTSAAPLQVPGTASTDRTADNLALWVRLITPVVVGGRVLAGGFYLGGITEGAISSTGDLGTNVASQLTASVSDWIAASSGAVPVVWSRTHGVLGIVSHGIGGSRPSQQRRRRS